MDNKDIDRLRKVLRYKKRYDLAELLAFSYSKVNESTTYGKRLYAMLSVFEIYSPPEYHEKLNNLTEQEKTEIYNAVLDIYPSKDYEPEITKVEYFVDYDLESVSLVEIQHLEKISFEYIQEQIIKCRKKLSEKDYEGALTNSRTLVESVCLYVIENSQKEKYNYTGNLIKLYKDTSNILNLIPSATESEFNKQLKSGLISIISGLSGLRNAYSDSHGTQPSNENDKIDLKNATFAVNVAQALSEYLYLCFKE